MALISVEIVGKESLVLTCGYTVWVSKVGENGNFPKDSGEGRKKDFIN